jgi:hypothetical protein
VTLWAIVDLLSKKKQHYLFKIWDYAVLLFGVMTLGVSIWTFQAVHMGTLDQRSLEELDSWVNVNLTLFYIVLNLFFYLVVKKEKKV